MIKKIVAVLVAILSLSLLMGTIAFADNGNGNGNRSAQPTDKGRPSDRAAERQQFLEQAKSLRLDIAENKKQIKAIRDELNVLRPLAMERLEAFKANPETLTEEDIQLLKSLMTQLHECRRIFANTNSGTAQQKNTLKQTKRDKNYDAALAAFGKIIAIQKTRMNQLSTMKGIFQQIIDIGNEVPAPIEEPVLTEEPVPATT